MAERVDNVIKLSIMARNVNIGQRCRVTAAIRDQGSGSETDENIKNS